MSKSAQRRQHQPRADERRAAAIVAAELGASTSTLDEPPLQNFADFKVHLPGRLPAVLEVTSHGDHERASLDNAMMRRTNEFRRPELSKIWALHLPDMRSGYQLPYKEVLKNLDQIVKVLRLLEAKQQFNVGGGSDRSIEAAALLKRGVYFAIAARTDNPGVVLVPPGDGGWSGTSAVVAGAISEARKSDNVRKLERGLGDGTASARHLFVWIVPSQMVPYFALNDRELPTEPPDLPDALTDLWIGGRYRSGDVVWHWDGTSWADVNVSVDQDRSKPAASA